jgi:putative endonuclease
MSASTEELSSRPDPGFIRGKRRDLLGEAVRGTAATCLWTEKAMGMSYRYFVYILSNRHRTVYYTGVTNDLGRRLTEHRKGSGSVFVARYQCVDLVYFEEHAYVYDALDREKQIKKWSREKKLALIRTVNQDLRDLSDELT